MYKITMLINNNGGIPCGWSETHYTDRTAITSVASLARQLVSERIKMLSPQFVIPTCRLSSDPNTRPVVTQLLPLGSPQIGLNTGNADYPNTAVLYTMTGGAGSISRDLRGWPDTDITGVNSTNIVSLEPSGKVKLDAYVKYLSGAALGWLRKARPGDPDYSAVNPNACTVDSASGWTKLAFNVPGPWAVEPRKSIIITGFGGDLSQLNGTYTAKKWEAGTGFILVNRIVSVPAALQYIPGTATVQLATMQYQTYSGGSYSRISSHRTGRPFGLLRGRR